MHLPVRALSLALVRGRAGLSAWQTQGQRAGSTSTDFRHLLNWRHAQTSRCFSAQTAAVNTAVASRKLEELAFDNTFVRELPGDPDKTNSIRQVFGSLFSLVSPTPPDAEPFTIAYSREVCALLDLAPEECERPEFALLFSGAAPLPGAQPYAQCYGGHQFGQWAGQLGDGRAITLGEVVNSRGERWELQLKGAGQTPYSRRADGRAVLRSSLREYVASEAMYQLGIPTTRALCLVGTGDQVLRDMFYNGNAQYEPGAVVCRVAPSFVRFGTFQLPIARGESDLPLVRQAADYVIRHHCPLASGAPNPYLSLLSQVIERTAKLVAMWQGIGFVHAVLNTDNMSILGVTLDYGPFAFMDKFDPQFTPNLTDRGMRRYAYRNQPEIGQWNLVALANAFIAAELVSKEEAEEVLVMYSKVLSEEYARVFASKLGLSPSKGYDKDLLSQLLTLMYEDDADWTNTFRALCGVPSSGSGLTQALLDAITNEAGGQLSEERLAAWGRWLEFYQAALRAEGVPDVERQAAQKRANPAYIPRQHLLQYAIDAAEAGQYDELHALMEVLKRPYDDQPEADPKYRGPAPEDMARRPGVCLLSCSS